MLDSSGSALSPALDTREVELKEVGDLPLPESGCAGRENRPDFREGKTETAMCSAHVCVPRVPGTGTLVTQLLRHLHSSGEKQMLLAHQIVM